MKKRLEADLISIAHRILQLKNKSDINQLYLETQKLYEKLAVLRFVEEHFGDLKPTIGQAEIVEKIENSFGNTIENSTAVTTEISPKENIDIEIDEEVDVIMKPVDPIELEQATETIEVESLESDDLEFQPAFGLNEEEDSIVNDENATEEIIAVPEEPEVKSISEPTEEVKIETSKKPEAVQVSFEDLLGGNYAEPKFVKRSQLEETPEIKNIENSLSFDFQAVSKTNPTVFKKEEPKSITLNDKLAKGIAIGLNDRIAFVKHLFGGNSEDYNRVLNQLITFDTFQETKNFIDEMVKPDYNHWTGKEDFEHRFMEIIEKKFLSF